MPDFVMKSTFLIVSMFLCCVKGSSTSLTTMPSNNLKPGDMLNSTTQLCSANKFCLKFLKQEISGFSYLVLHGQTEDTWVLWVGNRNEPIRNNSGQLILDDSGELKIVSQDKPIKVLYSPIQPINNTEAILLDNGNFVLQQLHPDGSTRTILWQSFDYPTDVLLPGMKLGVNHKTGHNWLLISWIAGHNPSPGVLRLEWEPKGRELIIRGQGVIYWRSGSLRSNGSFENIPDELSQGFTIVSNEDEDYFTLTSSKSDDKISFWGLNYHGLWDGKSGKNFVRLYNCSGFNNYDGCQLFDHEARCRHDGQYVEIVYGYPPDPNFTDIQTLQYLKKDASSWLTILDCQRRCWSDCDCLAVYTIYSNNTGCVFLYKITPELFTSIHSDDNTKSIYVLKGPSHSHRKGKRKWIWTGVVIAASLIFTICLFILCLILRKRKFRLVEKERQSCKTATLDLLPSDESTSINNVEENIYKARDIRIFNYSSVIEATNGFSSENKLGEGGFGPVYKGILPMGNEVAIKRLSKTSEQGIVEFKNELTLVYELQHMNLVQLLGYCIYEEERMLIYEFMPNKSLNFFLFDSTQSKLIDWQKRFNIIEGITQGLLYLHKHSRLKVIHRDLKASNILLDENMTPKISDFGMARMFKGQESKANTNRIVGTYGYMSPEYAMDGIFSTKSDVYSFGVLLLEIVSGRRSSNFHNDDGPFSIVEHAWKLWKEGAALQLMDPILIDSYVHDEVLRCIHIGILCVEADADDRPTMSNIVSMLTNQSVALSSPKRPAFNTRARMIDTESSSKESNVNSINEVTLSIVDAR